MEVGTFAVRRTAKPAGNFFTHTQRPTHSQRPRGCPDPRARVRGPDTGSGPPRGDILRPNPSRPDLNPQPDDAQYPKPLLHLRRSAPRGWRRNSEPRGAPPAIVAHARTRRPCAHNGVLRCCRAALYFAVAGVPAAPRAEWCVTHGEELQQKAAAGAGGKRRSTRRATLICAARARAAAPRRATQAAGILVLMPILPLRPAAHAGSPCRRRNWCFSAIFS